MTTSNCCKVSLLAAFPKDQRIEEDICPICQATYDEMAKRGGLIAKTSCGKYYDNECMRNYLKNGFTTCACCRQKIEIVKAADTVVKEKRNQSDYELTLAINSIVISSSLIGYVNIAQGLMLWADGRSSEHTSESSLLDSFRSYFTIGCAIYTSIKIGIAARELYSSSRN